LLLCTASASALVSGLPSTMNAVYKSPPILPCFTPFNCVKMHKINVPTPDSNQVLVQVAGSSVNPCGVDYLEFNVACGGGGGTLGMDLSGTVVAVGSNATRLKIGDVVWADVGGVKGDTGAMAEYAVVSEAQTGLAPSTLNLTEAGTIPLVGLTALEMFQKAFAAYGSGPMGNLTVVVTSGSGGTGFISVQLAKHAYGAARVITAASGPENIALVEEWGADQVVDYHEHEIFDVLADDSVDIVIDNYGAKGTADKAMKALRAGGVYLVLPGGNGGTVTKHPKAGVKQVNFGETSASDYRQLDILKEWFEQGKLKPHIYQQVPLSNASNAFALNKAGHVVGKVAVVVS